MQTFAQSTAVVTGAGAGIGRAFALHLARMQARVILADLDEAGAHDTAEIVRRHGGQALVVPCDVRQEASVAAVAEATRAWAGVPDLVVLNAGILVAGAFVGTESDAIARMVETNLMGITHGCRAFVPAMVDRGRGHLLNVASMAGLVPVPRMAAYAATKAAVVGLSESLFVELRPQGVGVTVLCPSFTRTGLVANASTTTQGVRALGQRLLDAVGAQPEHVAAVGLRAAARGRLYAIDSRHGRVVWGLKRMAPTLVARLAAQVSARVPNQ